MREHMGLFRGKRIDTGEWVYGFYVRADHHWHNHGIHKDWIICGASANGGWFALRDKHPVKSDTVGECTGLRDENGKLIFEGDIFHLEDELITVVIFKDGCFRLETYGMCGTYTESGYDECGGGWGIVECEYVDWYYVRDMKIIGNIHDNPEILKGGEGDGSA